MLHLHHKCWSQTSNQLIQSRHIVAYCRFRFHWFRKEMQILPLDCCGANKRSLIICKWPHTCIHNAHTHNKQAYSGSLFFLFFLKNYSIYLRLRQSRVVWVQSHVNEPGNWCVFICACRPHVSIERLWILIIGAEINKSARKRMATGRSYLYLQSLEAKQHLFVRSSLMAMQICWSTLGK